MQAVLAFFLPLNAIVCLWEICLFFEIGFIKQQYLKYKEEYKGRALQVERRCDLHWLTVQSRNWIPRTGRHPVFHPGRECQ